MTVPNMLTAVVTALRSAGATEEIIAAAVKAGGEFGDSPPRPNGRPRKHADDASRYRAYRARKRARHETRHEIPRDETQRDETPVPDARNLRVRLIDASGPGGVWRANRSRECFAFCDPRRCS
jgi:hypothetical protein